MAPESVSSGRFTSLRNCTTCHDGPNTYTIQGVYPIDYADFVGPIPVAAYQGMAACAYDECTTITQASYSPFLSVPSQIRSMQDVWSGCALFVDGIWDPPIALQQAQTEAGVSTSDDLDRSEPPFALSSMQTEAGVSVPVTRSSSVHTTSVRTEPESTVRSPFATKATSPILTTSSTEVPGSSSYTDSASSPAGESTYTAAADPSELSSPKAASSSSEAQPAGYTDGEETGAQQPSVTQAEDSTGYTTSTSEEQPAPAFSRLSSSGNLGGIVASVTGEQSSAALGGSPTSTVYDPGNNAATAIAISDG